MGKSIALKIRKDVLEHYMKETLNSEINGQISGETFSVPIDIPSIGTLNINVQPGINITDLLLSRSGDGSISVIADLSITDADDVNFFGYGASGNAIKSYLNERVASYGDLLVKGSMTSEGSAVSISISDVTLKEGAFRSQDLDSSNNIINPDEGSLARRLEKQILKTLVDLEENQSFVFDLSSIVDMEVDNTGKKVIIARDDDGSNTYTNGDPILAEYTVCNEKSPVESDGWYRVYSPIVKFENIIDSDENGVAVKIGIDRDYDGEIDNNEVVQDDEFYVISGGLYPLLKLYWSQMENKYIVRYGYDYNNSGELDNDVVEIIGEHELPLDVGINPVITEEIIEPGEKKFGQLCLTGGTVFHVTFDADSDGDYDECLDENDEDCDPPFTFSLCATGGVVYKTVTLKSGDSQCSVKKKGFDVGGTNLDVEKPDLIIPYNIGAKPVKDVSVLGLMARLNKNIDGGTHMQMSNINTTPFSQSNQLVRTEISFNLLTTIITGMDLGDVKLDFSSDIVERDGQQQLRLRAQGWLHKIRDEDSKTLGLAIGLGWLLEPTAALIVLPILFASKYDLKVYYKVSCNSNSCKLISDGFNINIKNKLTNKIKGDEVRNKIRDALNGKTVSLKPVEDAIAGKLIKSSFEHQVTTRNGYFYKESDDRKGLILELKTDYSGGYSPTSSYEYLFNDNDKDGFKNIYDLCPLIAADPDHKDSNNDAVGDECDRDGDGIKDNSDKSLYFTDYRVNYRDTLKEVVSDDTEKKTHQWGECTFINRVEKRNMGYQLDYSGKVSFKNERVSDPSNITTRISAYYCFCGDTIEERRKCNVDGICGKNHASPVAFWNPNLLIKQSDGATKVGGTTWQPVTKYNVKRSSSTSFKNKTNKAFEANHEEVWDWRKSYSKHVDTNASPIPEYATKEDKEQQIIDGIYYGGRMSFANVTSSDADNYALQNDQQTMNRAYFKSFNTSVDIELNNLLSYAINDYYAESPKLTEFDGQNYSLKHHLVYPLISWVEERHILWARCYWIPAYITHY